MLYPKSLSCDQGAGGMAERRNIVSCKNSPVGNINYVCMTWVRGWIKMESQKLLECL